MESSILIRYITDVELVEKLIDKTSVKTLVYSIILHKELELYGMNRKVYKFIGYYIVRNQNYYLIRHNTLVFTTRTRWWTKPRELSVYEIVTDSSDTLREVVRKKIVSDWMEEYENNIKTKIYGEIEPDSLEKLRQRFDTFFNSLILDEE